MRNITEKICTGNRTIFYIKIFFPKSCCLSDNVEKYGSAGPASDGNVTVRMPFACWRYGVLLCTFDAANFNFRAKDSVMRKRSLRN
jgi:hypothetical protein